MEWKEIPNSNGRYLVSDNGKVYSCISQQELSPRIHSGYHRYAIHPSRGERVDVFAHRLVLLAFEGPPPFEGAQVRHLNGDKLDNRLDNLRWGSSKEQAEDKIRLSEMPSGEVHHKSKLSESEVVEARKLYSNGESTSVLAEKYGVVRSTIASAIDGRTWGHLPGAVELRSFGVPPTEIDEEAARAKIEDGESYASVASTLPISTSQLWRRLKA